MTTSAVASPDGDHAVLGDRDVPRLVHPDVEAGALELVDETEALTAEEVGVVPLHDVATVATVGGADSGVEGVDRRLQQRPRSSSPSRSSGWSVLGATITIDTITSTTEHQ